MTLELFLLFIVVITALAFDFTNGFHDTGNAITMSAATQNDVAPPSVIGGSGSLSTRTNR